MVRARDTASTVRPRPRWLSSSSHLRRATCHFVRPSPPLWSRARGKESAMKKPILVLAISAALALAARLPAAQADAAAAGGYRILATHLLGGEGGWDLLTVDAEARRVYISR